MKKILVIGSANADLLNFAKRMPRLGETVEGYDFTLGAGGKGLNQSVAISKLGAEVSFIGAVGDDDYGKMLLDAMKTYNIRFEGVVRKDVSTGLAFVTVVQGDNFIIINEGANGTVSEDVIRSREDVIKEADFVVLQLEIPVESVLESAKIAKKYGKTVVLNPAPCKPVPEELYSYVDILIPNEHEAAALVGFPCDTEESVKKAVKCLKEKGVGTVIITLGERGCMYKADAETVSVPAVKTVAVDTTSAGDSFIGGLVCRLALGESIISAVKYATRVSSITVSRKGAAVSIPYAEEIE